MESLGITSSFAFAPALTSSGAPSRSEVSEASLYTSSSISTNLLTNAIEFAIN